MPDNPFGFALPGDQPPDPSDPQQMQRFLAQLQQLLAAPGATGPVNWDLARQVAASHLSSEGDPPVTSSDRDAVAEALRLADLWLDPTSALPSGVQASAAWNRNEWIYHTLEVWKRLCDPVAARMVGAMNELVPEEARAGLGPVQSMVATLGGALFGGQLGQALGSLAAEVLSAGDIGLPLGPAGTAALVPANITAYGEGLEIDAEQLRLYVALREAAHQRLFGHVPWLRGHLLSAVEAYANGIRVDRGAVEEALGRVDPTDPESMRQLQVEGIFSPESTPAQRAALARLETALALVEGWVCHVVDAAATDRLPDAVRLAEMFRRRRAAGGPAEQTFAALVGLELRPRRLREATALWSALTEHRGVDGRDSLWEHPDLLPTDEDFANPAAFAAHPPELGDLAELGDLGDVGDLAEPGDIHPRDRGDRGDKGDAGDGGDQGDAGDHDDGGDRGESGRG